MSIYDPNLVTISDVGRNFYVSEQHVGKVTRAEASLSELKDLNPSVLVEVATNAEIEYMYFFCYAVHRTSVASWF